MLRHTAPMRSALRAVRPAAAYTAVCSGRPALAASRSFHSHRLAAIQIASFDTPEPAKKPPPPVYDHTETPGSAFDAVPVDNLRRRDVAYGIGSPSVRTVQGDKPRRHTRPYGVQGIRTPMKTYVEGPRELGHSIVRTFVGKVTSDKMNKTVAVEVTQYYKHPKYHKYIKTSKKFLTHDEEEECNIGDVVEIRSCRAFSKRKHFTLHRILKPKLAIDEGASRFIEHQPAWKKPQQETTA